MCLRTLQTIRSLTAIMFKSVEDAGGPFNNPGTSADNADNADNAETDSVSTETGSEKLPPSKLVKDRLAHVLPACVMVMIYSH